MNKVPLDYVSGHPYFGGNAHGTVNGKMVKRDPAPLRTEMLFPKWHDKYTKYVNEFGNPVRDYRTSNRGRIHRARVGVASVD